MSFVPDKGRRLKRWRANCSAGNGGWSQGAVGETVANSLTHLSVSANCGPELSKSLDICFILFQKKLEIYL